MLENGADLSIQNDEGDTPLHKATDNGTLFYTLFFKEKCNVEFYVEICSGYENYIEQLINHGANINALNLHLRTPLHLAARESNILLTYYLYLELFN